MNTSPHHTPPSFEEVYPKAPFAELIRLSTLLADAFARLRARLTASRPASAEIAEPVGQ